jgi:uncharacterized membrane protein YjjB (DUF3815 family)
MDWITPLESGFWAALFAASLALALTAPARALPVVLAAGFAGRFSRDLLMQLDLAMPMATVLAALVATTLAVKASRQAASAPVTAITAVLPLGPTTLLFAAIRAAFNVFAKDPAVAAAAGTDFMVNALKAAIVIATMAIGTTVPLLLNRDRY